MAIDLLFNIILFVFFGFCLIDVSRLTNLPDSDIMGAALWPQMILVLLLIMLALNIRGIIKKTRSEPDKVEKINLTTVKDFFKSKLFVGILMVIAMSVIMDPLGFIISTFLLLCAYGFLLGARKIPKLILISLVVTFVLFFIFSKGLQIMLPRGYGPIREFSLMLENI